MAVVAPAAASAPPTLEEVRTWLDVPATTVTDDQLTIILEAETIAQSTYCTTTPYEAPLYQAMLRRCGREVAAMSLPLGVSGGDPEYGSASLPRYDVEIERLERPYRKTVLG